MTPEYLSWGLAGLFFMTFLAATLIPLASEAVFITYLVLGYDPIAVIFVATAGNSGGSILNYFIGRLGNPRWIKVFGSSEIKLASFRERIDRYGHWTGLLSWLPIIGDPLTLAMGFFRTRVVPSFLVITGVKLLRYVVLWLIWIYFS